MHLYGQYCPVARAAEILADRWTVLIVRELLADIHHFNELESGLPGISRSLLAARLRRLVQAGVLERRPAERGQRIEYRVTPSGRELQRLIDVLGDWGARWAFGDPRPNELDPLVLLWWMRRRVCFERLARRRVVLQFEFRGVPRRRYWLLIGPDEASVCLQNPGFDIDVIVTAEIVAFYRVGLAAPPWPKPCARVRYIWRGHLPIFGPSRIGLRGAPWRRGCARPLLAGHPHPAFIQPAEKGSHRSPRSERRVLRRSAGSPRPCRVAATSARHAGPSGSRFRSSACWSAWRRKSKLNDPLTMLQCSVEILHCSAMERP